jgi:N-acetylmuramoyl-L-alanine amidase
MIMPKPKQYFAAVGLALLMICGQSDRSRADEVKVAISGGHEKIQAYHQDRIRYISLSGLVDVLGGALDWETIGHQVRYATGRHRFDFVIGSPYINLDDTAYNLTYPTVYRQGQLFVVPSVFLPFLDRVTLQKITWDENAATIRVESDYFNVTDIAFSPKANGLLIEIYLTTAMAYDVFVTEGNWLNVSIPGARINSPRLLSRKDSRYMYRLKTHQIEGTGQVSVRLKRNIESWHHKLVLDPPRIQLSIADVGFEIDSADTNPIIGPDERIDVIVIDPGHGGSDYGAIGPGGTREKEVVLNIARELAKLIRKDRQFKVIMTRDRDKYLSLEERASIANQARADLFISIHANASPKRRVRGWNVFFLAPARNDSARAVAQFENSVFLRELSVNEDPEPYADADPLSNPIVGILNEMIMTEFQEESHDFALMVDREFRRDLKIPARGVDQAGFFVLNKVFTPSVLIEAGFISNKTEEKKLKDKKFRKKVAEGLYSAIKRFRAKYENQ